MLVIGLAHNFAQILLHAVFTWCRPKSRKQLSRKNFAIEQMGWLGKHCPDFIDKDSWPRNSPDLNPSTITCWRIPELKQKPQNVTDLKRRCRSQPLMIEGCAADYLERSAWWNDSQICSQFVQTTSQRAHKRLVNDIHVRLRPEWVQNVRLSNV